MGRTPNTIELESLTVRYPPGVGAFLRSEMVRLMKVKGRQYSMNDVQNILVLISEFDYRLRLYKAEHHGLLLELFLYYLMIKKGRLPELPQF